MNAGKILILPILALVVTACAGAGVSVREEERLERRLVDLRRSLDETNARVEELNNKFLLLHEKVEGNRKNIEKLQGDHADLPEGLKVVTLDGDGEDAASVKPLKKAVEPADKGPVRGKTAEKAPSPAAQPAAKAAPKAAEAKGPEELYNRGQDLFMAGDYGGARSVFRTLAERFPDHGLADNAVYWAGEAYYSEKDYERALVEFLDVLNRYPEGNKAPDAFLKVGYSYIELGQTDKAEKALTGLVGRYPGTEAARKAERSLSWIAGQKKEGSR